MPVDFRRTADDDDTPHFRLQPEDKFQIRARIDALGDAADGGAKLIGAKFFFRQSGHNDRRPRKQSRQLRSRDAQVSYENQDHQIGRMRGVFRRQILGKYLLIPFARESDQIEILGVGFNRHRGDFHQRLEQLLIDQDESRPDDVVAGLVPVIHGGAQVEVEIPPHRVPVLDDHRLVEAVIGLEVLFDFRVRVVLRAEGASRGDPRDREAERGDDEDRHDAAGQTLDEEREHPS